MANRGGYYPQNYRNDNQPDRYVENQNNVDQANDRQQAYPGNYNRSFRGGRGGFNQRVKETRPPIDTAEKPRKKTGSAPMGQHLSKTSSELKNDPLYMDAFMPKPAEELTEIAEELNHYTGFSGLTGIINESFDNFAAKSVNFKRSIPPSAYAYYIAVMTWARALKLKMLNKYRLTTEERDFVNIIYEQGNYVLPNSISMYLSGFGNFNIPAGPESKFDMKAYAYDDDGYFVDLEDNFYSAAYPCIAIYAARIVHDIAYSDGVGEPAWQVDDIDRAWNTRCLGYAPSQRLNEMVLRIFTSCNITADEFPVDVAVIPVNIRLLNNIQKFICEVPTIETSPLPTNLVGSVGQMVMCTPERTLRPPEDIGSYSFVASTPLMIPGSTSYLGGTFLYRIDKGDNNSTFFFPYDIRHPTDAQREQLNNLNTGWSPLLEGIKHYSNVPFKSNLRMKKVCSIDIKSI